MEYDTEKEGNKKIFEGDNMKVKIDREESEILESYDNDEWVEIPDMEGEINKHAAYAKETMKKDNNSS